jgi:hypothetical protein
MTTSHEPHINTKDDSKHEHIISENTHSNENTIIIIHRNLPNKHIK